LGIENQKPKTKFFNFFSNCQQLPKKTKKNQKIKIKKYLFLIFPASARTRTQPVRADS
jgi:hypothetical protein